MKKDEIIIKLADSRTELHQILELQNANHVSNLTTAQKLSNGFVTVKHSIDLLEAMNTAAPQVIAKHRGSVVAYALTMLHEFKHMIPVLIPMFEMFNSLYYKQKNIQDYSYYVMGQICIDEYHRGKKIFEQLYLKHKENFSHQYEICLTEVAVDNLRSMKAHERVGFQTIHTFKDNTEEWNILLWDWN